jgi:hypothetical protein
MKNEKGLLCAKKFVSCMICALLIFHLTSCGTILYPERRGQDKHQAVNKIDMAVFAMDTGLCLLGLLPGIIAFAIDFSSGCIYLPERQVSIKDMDQIDMTNWRVVKVDPDTLNQATIERIIQEQTGKSIQLNSPDLLLAKPDNRDINIIQELENLQTKNTNHLEGFWFTGSQMNCIHDSSGRLVKIEVTAPTNTYLALN